MFHLVTASSQVLNDGTFKFGRTLSLIDAFYVDSVNIDMLTEKAIIEILKTSIPTRLIFQQKMLKR